MSIEAQKGLQAMLLGHYQLAANHFQAALRAESSAKVAFNLGLAYQRLGQNPESESAYRHALELNPLYTEAQQNLATVLNAQQRYFEAEGLLRQLLADFPWNTDICSNLAATLVQQGRPQDAASLLYPCLKRDPVHPIGCDTLGACLMDMGNTVDASGCFARAHTQAPLNSRTLFNLYSALFDSRAPEQALRCLREAAKLDPSDPQIAFHLAFLTDTEPPNTSWPDAWTRSWRFLNEHPDAQIIGSVGNMLEFACSLAQQPGLVAEFGVRFGTTIRQLHQHLQQPVHGFDSFQGLPIAWHNLPAGSYSTQGQVPVLGEEITLHEGWYQDTLPGFCAANRQPIRLLNIDCDLYESTKTVLELLGPQLQVGSIVIFDELIMNEHWEQDEFRAWSEYVEQTGVEFQVRAASILTSQVVVEVTACA